MYGERETRNEFRILRKLSIVYEYRAMDTFGIKSGVTVLYTRGPQSKFRVTVRD